MAVLGSEGLALVSVSAQTASSVVVTDPMEFRKSTRDLKAQSAATEHSNEGRGSSRDPGVGRPGANIYSLGGLLSSFLSFIFLILFLSFFLSLGARTRLNSGRNQFCRQFRVFCLWLQQCVPGTKLIQKPETLLVGYV